jgi:hypothetical protein
MLRIGGHESATTPVHSQLRCFRDESAAIHWLRENAEKGPGPIPLRPR